MSRIWMTTLLLLLCGLAPAAHAQGYDAETVREFQQRHQLGIELLTRAEETAKKGGNADADFAAAVKAFERCIELIPDNASAYYNIACAYSLWSKPAEALDWLKQSMDHGFLDFSHMEADDDLDPIRHTEGYRTLLADYHQQLVDDAFYKVVRPRGFAPETRYPVIVALHNDGDNAYEFSRTWNAAADAQPCLVICPQGTVADPQNESAYQWGNYTAEAVVKGVLGKVQDSPRYTVDAARVYLAGQEVGAIHALEIGLKNPDRFKGLIVFNPPINADALSGWLKEAKAKRPIAVLMGSELPPAYRQAVLGASQAIERAGFPTKRFAYTGGPGLPEDAKVLGEVLDWLAKQAAPDAAASPPAPGPGPAAPSGPTPKPAAPKSGVEEF